MDFFPTPRCLPPIASDDAIQIGDAGERLVEAAILAAGYRCYAAGRGCPFDLLAESNDQFLRIQVKTSASSRQGRWVFKAERGYRGSATGRYAYSRDDFDIGAYVALPIFRVVFLRGVRDSVVLRTEDFLRHDYREGFEAAIEAQRPPLIH